MHTPRDHEEPVGFWEWVLAGVLLAIPLIGFVCLIYWSVSDSTKTSKRNFARAQLFFVALVLLVFGGIFALASGSILASFREGYLAGREGGRHAPPAADADTAGAFTPPAEETTTNDVVEAPPAARPGALSTQPNPPASRTIEPKAATDASISSPAAVAHEPEIATSKPPTLTPDEPTRKLRAADGRTIDARVIALTDDEVTIQRVNGQEFTVEMSKFSPEDVAYFMRLRHGQNAFEAAPHGTVE